ncbi:SDR family oxidoreductase [Streptomyces fuscigenes]|uniref:SDR family oxidoreductase n=1 Tax=Streptomyces fuscigenes TaxID=1528880 RepID=UPI001EEA8271|nr:SDR family oxidoreductase [Streptomyces fuscigenes]MCF3965111.1 SDR family NAD(P)-dependent oxidoreductase [Streptomyces fuscigenes]
MDEEAVKNSAAGDEAAGTAPGTAGGDSRAPAGRIALVAGATRGAGRQMAVQLGALGATVYATGRTTRDRVSEVGRATETIEETAELVTAAGGTGVALPADHLDPAQVRAVVERIAADHGRLDVLVDDIWGGEPLVEFGKRAWELDLGKGLRMLDLGVRGHLITLREALPLLVRHEGGLVIEVTDGTEESGEHYRGNLFYDLTKQAPIRMVKGLARELAGVGCTAVSLTPGFLRSEWMLDHFGVREENWRDAVAREPAFAIAESPVYVGRAVAALAADEDRHRWNGRSLSSGQLAKVYGFTDTDGSAPDAWPYIEALTAADGATVDARDYR